MKSLSIILVFCLWFCCSDYALAQSTTDEEGGITYAWTANTESDLAGYKIYIGKTSKKYDYGINVKNVTSYTMRDLDIGVGYFAALTAYDNYGNESKYSVEVSGKAKDIVFPKSPIAFREVTTNVNP